MAEQVCPPDDAARTENRQGGHGAKTGGSPLLDDAQGMGLRAVEKVRFAPGTARKSRWGEVKHRVIYWASRSPLRGVRSSNHDRRCDRRDAWVELSFRPETITSGPLVGMAEPSTRAKWRALRSARSSTLKKCLTGIHIVREAISDSGRYCEPRASIALRNCSARRSPKLCLSLAIRRDSKNTDAA